MLTWKETEAQIKKLQQNSEWGEIVKLLGCDTAVSKELDYTLKVALPWYYSNIIINLLVDDFKSAIRSYELFREAYAQAIGQQNLSDKDRMALYKMIAYLNYHLYYDNRIWSRGFCAEKHMPLKDKLQALRFNRTYFRNNGIYYYSKILSAAPEDIKSLYRFAHFVEYIRIISGNPNIKEKGMLNFTEQLDVTDAAELNTFRNFVNKNGLPVAHLFQYGKKELPLYQKVVSLYEQLTDEEQKKRVRKEYIKAMYRFCSIVVDDKKRINTRAMGMQNDFSDCTHSEDYATYANEKETLTYKETVRQYLWKIMQMENLPLDKERFCPEKIVAAKNAEEANYVYYTLAKFLLYFKIQEGDTGAIAACLKAAYFAAVVDFYILTIPSQGRKSSSKYIYTLFSDLLNKLNLFEESKGFVSYYCKRLNAGIVNEMKTEISIAKEMSDCDFIEANKLVRAALATQKAAANKMYASHLKKMQQRIDFFLEHPDAIEQFRVNKINQRLAKNSLESLGFYEKCKV